MGKRLQTVEDHVTDITISTATVDIQVMRIGTKQMTLAVFRQLPYKEIFDLCGNLWADPWGWVNYDRNGSSRKPFVYSLEGILYRCDVNLGLYDYDLDVVAQTKWVDGHYEPDAEQGRVWVSSADTPTGYWIIIFPDGGNCFGVENLRFTTEEGARTHLENRMASAAVLKAAPQLFIGV